MLSTELLLRFKTPGNAYTLQPNEPLVKIHLLHGIQLFRKNVVKQDVSFKGGILRSCKKCKKAWYHAVFPKYRRISQKKTYSYCTIK